MANEIISRLQMQFVPSGLTPNLAVDFKKYTKKIDMAGSERSRFRQIAPISTAILLDIGADIGTEGIILIQNLGPNFVAIGTDNMRVACTAVANNGSGKARYSVLAHGLITTGLVEHSTFADSNYNGSKAVTRIDDDTYDTTDTYTATGTGQTDSVWRGVAWTILNSNILVRNNGSTFYILASVNPTEIEVICLED